jgi:hypothetical protein
MKFINRIDVEVGRRFRGAYCLHHQGDESVYFNVTTRRYIQEDSDRHTRRSENLKSHIVDIYGENTLRSTILIIHHSTHL